MKGHIMTDLKWSPSLETPEVLLWDGREIARIEDHAVTFMQFSTMYKKIPFGTYSDPRVPRQLLEIARRTLGLAATSIHNAAIPSELPSRELVQKIIRFCHKKNVTISRHYSGRGMFGKQCIGFYGDSGECAAVAVFIRRKTGYDYCRDNFGLDMIYYFPDIHDPSPNTLNPQGEQE
jgi:hypothetical protein